MRFRMHHGNWYCSGPLERREIGVIGLHLIHYGFQDGISIYTDNSLAWQ